MKLRNLREDETELLKDFSYEAIFIPEGVKPPKVGFITVNENEEEFIMVSKL